MIEVPPELPDAGISQAEAETCHAIFDTSCQDFVICERPLGHEGLHTARVEWDW